MQKYSGNWGAVGKDSNIHLLPLLAAGCCICEVCLQGLGGI